MREHDKDCDIYATRVCTCGKILAEARQKVESIDRNVHECRLMLLSEIDRVGARVRRKVADMCAEKARRVAAQAQ